MLLLTFVLLCSTQYISSVDPFISLPYCFLVTNFEMKNGKDTVWLIFFFPYPLKLVIYEEEWEMSWCLPNATLLLLLLLLFYFFSPRHTHTPPCQSLFPWGQWGRHSRAQATAECASEGKRERQSLSVLHSKRSAVLLCLQHLSFA